MRTLLTLFLAAVAGSAAAQIAPEYTYQGDTVSPISLRATGAFYYRFDNTAKKAFVFNGAHQLLKTINTPATGAVALRHLSETAVNSDTLAEVLYDESSTANGGTAISRIINEAGSMLMATTVPSGSSRMDELPGLPGAVIVREPSGAEKFSVYRAPGFVRVGPFYFHTRRITIDGVGEKILAYGLAGYGTIHNTDGTAWKTLPLSSFYTPCMTQGLTFGGLGPLFVSKQLIDADTGLEVVTRGFCNGASETRIARENGQALLTVTAPSNDAPYVDLNVIAGHPNKIIVNEAATAKVYSIPGLTLEHTYTDSMSIYRIQLALSGVKYMRYNPKQHRVELFNTNHSFWKAVPLVLGSNEDVGGIYNVSETDLNADSNVEVLYGVSEVPYTATSSSFLRVANETGGVVTVADITDDIRVVFHKFPDGVCKIAASAPKQTRIYGTPIAVPVIPPAPPAPAGVTGLQRLDATMSPNPSTGDVLLRFAAPASQPRVVSCYNLQGTLVYRATTAAGQFQLGLVGQPKGLYQVIVTEGDRRFSEKLLLH